VCQANTPPALQRPELAFCVRSFAKPWNNSHRLNVFGDLKVATSHNVKKNAKSSATAKFLQKSFRDNQTPRSCLTLQK
jgi:hypothetical protein